MGAAFSGGFEALEDTGPQLFEVCPERGNAGRIDLIDTLGAGMPITDQASILEYAQVLRDGWPADGKASREFDHGQRPLGQTLQYGNARRIAQCVQSGA